MKTYRKLTLQTLKDHGACTDQLKLFQKTFGDSVNVTVKRAVAAASLFDWSWARCLLSATARAEYDRVCAPARAEYDRVRATAWATAYINDMGG